MSTEFRVFLLVAAAVAGFCFRAGEQSVTAQQLPNCPSVDCRDVFAWSVAGFNPASADDPVTGKASTHAMVGIYTPNQAASLPVSASGQYQRYEYPTVNSACAKINGAWPSPVEMTKATGNQTNAGTPTRNVCTPKKGGGGED